MRKLDERWMRKDFFFVFVLIFVSFICVATISLTIYNWKRHGDPFYEVLAYTIFWTLGYVVIFRRCKREYGNNRGMEFRSIAYGNQTVSTTIENLLEQKEIPFNRVSRVVPIPKSIPKEYVEGYELNGNIVHIKVHTNPGSNYTVIWKSSIDRAPFHLTNEGSIHRALICSYILSNAFFPMRQCQPKSRNESRL